MKLNKILCTHITPVIIDLELVCRNYMTHNRSKNDHKVLKKKVNKKVPFVLQFFFFYMPVQILNYSAVKKYSPPSDFLILIQSVIWVKENMRKYKTHYLNDELIYQKEKLWKSYLSKLNLKIGCAMCSCTQISVCHIAVEEFWSTFFF